MYARFFTDLHIYSLLIIITCHTVQHNSVVDPGFSQGGGANSPTYEFGKFSQKLHAFERIWAPRVGYTPL